MLASMRIGCGPACAGPLPDSTIAWGQGAGGRRIGLRLVESMRNKVDLRGIVKAGLRSNWRVPRPGSCERTGWQAEAPAPQGSKSFDSKVGRTPSSANPPGCPIIQQLPVPAKRLGKIEQIQLLDTARVYNSMNRSRTSHMANSSGSGQPFSWRFAASPSFC